MSDRDCEKCKHHTEKGCEKWNCEFERKVTRKEAIKVFKDMKKGVYPFDPNVYLDIAINSLEIDERYELEYEQIEPCEDAISRQAVLDFIGKQIDHSLWAFEKLVNGIKDLPSVKPQVICPSHGIDCEDCPAYEPKTDVLDKIRAEIEQLHYHPKLDFIKNDDVVGMVLDIIDKYRTESEG